MVRMTVSAAAIVAFVWCPSLRDVHAKTSDGMSLMRGFFTTSVRNLMPAPEITNFRLAPAARELWFFSEVRCEDDCIDQLRDNGSLELVHYWFYRVGTTWTREDVVRTDMTEEAGRDSGWRFPSRKKNLRQGTYRVSVKGAGQDLCSAAGICEVTIDVQ